MQLYTINVATLHSRVEDGRSSINILAIDYHSSLLPASTVIDMICTYIRIRSSE